MTEGSSSTAFIVSRERVLVTRPLSTALLPGITRASVLKLAGEADLKVENRLFSVAEAYEAQEAFYTSASAFVMPVVEIDGRSIGEGRPGPADPAPADSTSRPLVRVELAAPRSKQERIRHKSVALGTRVPRGETNLVEEDPARRFRGGSVCCSRIAQNPDAPLKGRDTDPALPAIDPDAAGSRPPQRRRAAQDQSLSDKLQKNDGVIKPPETGTTGTVVKPDETGSMPVIKPQELPGRTPAPRRNKRVPRSVRAAMWQPCLISPRGSRKRLTTYAARTRGLLRPGFRRG